jgi:hypothetical protein
LHRGTKLLESFSRSTGGIVQELMGPIAVQFYRDTEVLQGCRCIDIVQVYICTVVVQWTGV